MLGRARNQRPVADLEIDDLTQEIDEPLDDRSDRADEPTLTKIDFEEDEISLEL